MKVSFNTNGIDITIHAIGQAQYGTLSLADLISSDPSYFTCEDEEDELVICKTLDQGEVPGDFDLVYTDADQQERTATAQEFIGSRPPRRPF